MSRYVVAGAVAGLVTAAVVIAAMNLLDWPADAWNGWDA